MIRIFFIHLFIAGLITGLSAQPESAHVSYFESKFSPEEKTIYYKLGDRTIPVIISQYGADKDIAYVNVHDSEPTSVTAARRILETTGGTLIRIENRRQRNIQFKLKGQLYTFDPNRIFDKTGIVQTLKTFGRTNADAINEIEKFAQRLLELIPSETGCIVALHNNTDGAYSVKSYLPSGDRHHDAKAVYANHEQDIDDIALTTDSVLYQRMANEGYNSIWQHNKKAKRDGSLSIYCGEKDIRYINIETQLGSLAQHIEMLEKLLAILKEGKENDGVVKTDNAVK